MTKTITTESFLDSKELREEAKTRVEVLDKVKQLFLIPELECMTIKQVADYYEVDFETIKKQYQRNQDEFDSDGVHFKPLSNFQSLDGTKCPNLKMAQRRGFLELTLPDGTIVAINNKGVKCFPKRAILRMGMLLRDSVVAKEVRTQLLNTFEHATTEQCIAEIDEEIKLRNNIASAYGSGNPMEVLQACSMLDAYRMRHIATIERHNAELAKKNADLVEKNEKVVSNNKALTVENDIYAKDVLQWTDRASANRAVRVLATMCFRGSFDYAWNTIYKELAYKYGITVKTRAALDKKKKALLSYIKDNEWIYLFREIAALCNQNKGNVEKLFADAKINISNLDLTA